MHPCTRFPALSEETGDAYVAMGGGHLLSCLERRWQVDTGPSARGEGRDMGNFVSGLS